MTNPLAALASASAALMLMVTLAACSVTTDGRGATASDPSVPAPAVTLPPEAEEAMARYGLAEMDAVTLIDTLDRLGGRARPADLMASVRPTER